LNSDDQDQLQQMQQRQLGIVVFMGELYKHMLLPESVLHLFLSQALDDLIAPDSHEVETACKLLFTAGQTLDGPRSRSQMDDFVSRLDRISKVQSLPSRLRFMILDLLELRRLGWVPRRAATVDPKKLAAVKEDLDRERSLSSQSGFSRNNTPHARPPTAPTPRSVAIDTSKRNKVGLSLLKSSSTVPASSSNATPRSKFA
jgi:translation initiation factor 4G